MHFPLGRIRKTVTATQGEYEDLAVDLASDPRRLSEISDKLSANRLSFPLFDTRLFTAHLEAAYTTIYERYQGDLPPDHIYVSDRGQHGSRR
jgi:protein O-GlcNAc transferase